MNEEIELLRQMRDLLLVMAEPAIAKRDQKLREALSATVGRSKAKMKAVLLMDGTRTQTTIEHEANIDKGSLSRFV
jgi:hypothetical protein